MAVDVSTTKPFTNIWNTADGDGANALAPALIGQLTFYMQCNMRLILNLKNEHIASKNKDFKKQSILSSLQQCDIKKRVRARKRERAQTNTHKETCFIDSW